MISNKPGSCNICGAKLNKRSCKTCEGNGTVQKSITQMATTCGMCGGSGLLYICPNIKKHLKIKDLEPIPGPKKSGESVIPPSITCPVCFGKTFIVHPSTVCTRCGGKGWIDVPEFK